MIMSAGLTGCFTIHEPLEPVLVDKAVITKKVDLKAARMGFLYKMTKPAERQAFQQASEQTVFTAQDAKAILGTLCQGGKPSRGVTHNIEYVLPRPQAGVALDLANKAMVRDQQLMNQFVATFYERMTSQLLNDRIFDRDLSRQDMGGRPHGHPQLLAPDSDNVKADVYVSQLKDLRSKEKGERIPIVIEFPHGNSNWIMSHVQLPGFFRSVTFQDHTGRTSKYDDIPPEGLHEAVPLELLAISGHFTLVVSREEAARWASVAESRRIGRITVALPDAGQHEGLIMAQSELLRDRRLIFSNYLVANTSIRQSATDDGQVFAFTLSLNTEPLCRAARPTDSLRSK